MKKSKTLGYSPYGTGVHEPFSKLFAKAESIHDNPMLDGIDAIVLWGGRDINPAFYRAKPHWRNEAKSDKELTERDAVEWHWIHRARELNIPIIGVCRGAQMLCAFAGGSLFQDVTGHTNGLHPITIAKDNSTLLCNSYHHQMMDLRGTNYDMLAWSTQPRSSHYDYDSVDADKVNTPIEGKEPEVVYFTDIHAMAVQGHPEWLDKDHLFNKWLLDECVDYLNL